MNVPLKAYAILFYYSVDTLLYNESELYKALRAKQLASVSVLNVEALFQKMCVIRIRFPRTLYVSVRFEIYIRTEGVWITV